MRTRRGRAAASPSRCALALGAALLTRGAAAQLQWAHGGSTSTDTNPFDYNASVVRLDAVPDSRCCAWRRWCPGGQLRFRCTPDVLSACDASGGVGPRCTACAACAAAAATPAAVALRATAPLTDASQACIDTLRPLKTAYASVLDVPPSVIGAPPASGLLTVTSLGSAVPDAALAPGAPRFVVCASVAFRCVSARPAGGGACAAVRGARTPREGSAFARLWDSRGRASQEGRNAGGALPADHATLVVNPDLWAYRPEAVESLPDRRGVEGNDNAGIGDGLFGANATRFPAVRPAWLWDVNPTAPPPPSPPP